jgi:ribonucleotide reductase beta subunit family protein with ferritin-like domain
MTILARCQQKQSAYIVTYPDAVNFAEMQQSIAWPPLEIPVEGDIQEFLTAALDSDRHAVTTVLKLFTKYELVAGNEYWGNRIAKKYPRVCIQRMANSFANAELNMHAPFYNELNKVLNLDTEEFYNSYLEDETLSARMEHIDEVVSFKNDLLSVGAFSIVEGAILYSAFAFLKHYRVGGKNMFKNLISGINFSVRDENLHSEGGAWLFRTHKKELEEAGTISASEQESLREEIYSFANTVFEHECKIISMLFEKGSIPGITEKQLIHFVESRINMCLKNLGYEPLFKVTYNPIADWFYDNINAVKLHDFFDTTGSEYNRSWNQDRFNTWDKHE